MLDDPTVYLGFEIERIWLPDPRISTGHGTSTVDGLNGKQVEAEIVFGAISC